MVVILSPNLRATSSIRHNTSGVATADIDWSVRAPIGIVLNALTMMAAINDVSGIATAEAEMIHGVSLDPNENSFADVMSFTPQADVVQNNSDFVGLQMGQFDGDNAAGLAAASQQYAPTVQYQWAMFPPEARPTTFRPLRHLFELNVSIEWVTLIVVEYQLARFSDDEVAAFAATRP